MPLGYACSRRNAKRRRAALKMPAATMSMKKCATKPTAADVEPILNDSSPNTPLPIACRMRTGGMLLTNPWYVQA